ncbi:hypothetical protein [Cyanobacterium aponinum]|uniref:Uncharacterized protein n=1 Tax=Cyanobacterium aponinum 0216 TaxID=2676140 RepID=A0A844GSM9_9CHRO|nr:hypothetical protein [Cyanobacterium aponinum]MTF39514.1 hypothetical protein [Cyanobacterium aponinum 0216]
MTPSEFYKMRRPEYFSDSEIINKVTLPREQLAYELNKISTNQKQDQFETLCRRLAEKLIAPNLIPQVGPTGGGDGKTDFETYPISTSISDRWFTPENGWQKDEKWAFAISAKEKWESKLKSDIAKIVETNRGYTRVYFLTNQLISSKKKKDAQDEFIKEFEVDVTILDGEWILEKIYTNNLIDLVVDSLNLSSVYKNKEIRLGKNDAERLKQLEEIENNINNPNKYFEYDYQLVEDALESAILSRMLEKPRDEVEGKFDRVFRYCKKINNPKHWIRCYYQRAWTYINYYDDYQLFIEDYKTFKQYISEKSNIYEIELYYNLFNLLNTLYFSKNCNFSNYQIDINQERNDIKNILVIIENNPEKPSSALRAKTYRIIHETFDSIRENKNPNKYLRELANIILQSRQFWDYPFESTKQIIEEIGSKFPNNSEYDNLIDNVAEVSEKRNSELSSGETFLKRGIQKLKASYYQESIIYFGKAIVKLAKEETQKLMYLTLMGLGFAYRKLDLIWASNNCYISACCLSFKTLDEQGSLNKKIYDSLKEIIQNELLIGRIPSFLTWYEMFSILSERFCLDEEKKEDYLSFETLTDGCFSVRILHTNTNHEQELKYFPDLLGKLELWSSQNTILYKQGYTDSIIGDYPDINNEQQIDNFFRQISQQPFVEQILYETNFMSDNILKLKTSILGCKFTITFPQDIEILLVAETILAFLEGFFATSLKDAISHTENISVNIKNSQENQDINFDYDEISSEYNFYIESCHNSENNSNLTWDSLIKFVAEIFYRHFMTENRQEYIIKLFEKEEINERLSFILSQRNFMLKLLGKKPKLFFNDWINYVKPQEYPIKRQQPIIYDYQHSNNQEYLQKKEYHREKIDEIGHHKRTVYSIIDPSLWDEAKWNGFGTLNEQGTLGIFLLYENLDIGKKIFTQWLNKFGYEDKEEYIKITIIKDINKQYPYRYRVNISANIDAKNADDNNTLFSITSRINEIHPNNPDTLNYLINMFNKLKEYKIYPAKIIDDAKDIEPYFDLGILKKSLTIKEAWQIGENDLDRVAIREDDCPIIPEEHIQDAPILEILKHLKK